MGTLGILFGRPFRAHLRSLSYPRLKPRAVLWCHFVAFAASLFRPFAVSPVRPFAHTLLAPPCTLHPSPLLDLDLILHFCRRAKSLEETEVAGAGCGYLE
jgi:hypothetical protein